jgi:hypothetical protein
MGTPQPEPPVIGEQCHLCDGVLWLPGDTPLYIKCIFTGITTCPGAPAAAPNGEWILTQRELYPCQWRYADDTYQITFRVDVNWCRLSCGWVPFLTDLWFRDEILPTCQRFFYNEFTECIGPPPYGAGGVGIIVPPGFEA